MNTMRHGPIHLIRNSHRLWRRLLGPYLVLMLITALIPMAADSPTPDFLLRLDPGIQNLLHIPLFTLLIWILFGVYGLDFSRKMLVPITLATAAAIAYGMLLEILQVFVPGRYASFDDALFNILGVAIGLLGWFFLMRASRPHQ